MRSRLLGVVFVAAFGAVFAAGVARADGTVWRGQLAGYETEVRTIVFGGARCFVASKESAYASPAVFCLELKP